MEYFDDPDWINEKFGPKFDLKFRIKETAVYYKDSESHTFIPMIYAESIPENYSVDNCGMDGDWIQIHNIGFGSLSLAKNFCENYKPFLNKIEIKYHDL